MNLTNIPEAFQSKIRLSIIAALFTGRKTFNELKEVLKVTDGNLSTHLRKLEVDGYITVSKEFALRKPRSTYCISESGKQEFIDYVTFLEEILRNSDS
ncbi:MAG: transcriptional regulator [Bacillota bacterium]